MLFLIFQLIAVTITIVIFCFSHSLALKANKKVTKTPLKCVLSHFFLIFHFMEINNETDNSPLLHWNQSKIPGPEEERVPYHSNAIKAQHIEHHAHDGYEPKGTDQFLNCWRIATHPGVIPHKFCNFCF